MKAVAYVAAMLTASLAATPALAQEQGHVLTILHPNDAKFQSIPNAAACNTMMSLRGDMSKEAATFTSKMTPGCVAPWHWHNSTEEVIMVQGTAKMQMTDNKHMPMILPTGSYSQLPMRGLHRFKCMKGPDCIIIVVADRAFDIHWVDKDRKEITFDQALKLDKAGAPW